MELEIRHLRAICAIADAGSLSRAAAWLGVSQPSLSAQLRRLERAFGGELFTRSRHGVQPTSLGAQTLRRARPLLADLDAFTGGLARGASDVRATLRMGSAHMECVGTMIAEVRDSLPAADVRLQVESSALTLAQGLAHDRLDLAVIGAMEDHDVVLAPEIMRRVLIPRFPVYVAISARHPLAAEAAIELAALSEEDWIAPPGSEDGSLASLREACERAGFTARVAYEAPSGGGRQLIASGQAVQLVEPTSAGIGDLVIRPLLGDPLSMRMTLAWRPGRLSEVEARAVYAAVARAYDAHAARHPAFGEWWAAHPEVHPFAPPEGDLRLREDPGHRT